MDLASHRGRIVAGRYHVVRPLGAGAHGAVDLAEDLLRGGRLVALKRVEGLLGAGDPEPAADRLRWFLHPNWAEILDEGRLPDHGRFQVTRYVAGTSLAEVSGPRPVEEAWALLEDGARVLAALHGLGLIHYDVTPGNILREERADGSVRFVLTDGGLANVGAVKGIARGSPRFMAPEVAEGSAQDHRADLYSLGLVVWRFLAGKDPVEGGAGDVLGRRRREDAPPLHRARPDVPHALEAVVMSLVEREPAARPESAAALLQAIARARGTAVAAVTEEEALALATGGPLVGRAAEVQRFRKACRALVGIAAGSSPGEAAAAGTASVEAPDPVLVVHGAPGCGGTRLVKEWAAVARSEDVAVLSVSGREGAADRRNPLRRVADALSALSGGDPAGGRIDERKEHDAPGSRAVERFVDLCERTAARAPFALVVEDFAELPEGTKEAIRVLARHLIARAERPDGRARPRCLLAVDHGAEEPAGFSIPDAAEPARPCVRLSALSAGEAKDLLASRLSGLEMPPADLARVSAVTEGMPRTLVAYLAEGLARGDARRAGAAWLFDVDRIGAYEVEGTLSPATARALAKATAEDREALARLALLGMPAPEALAARVTGAESLARLSATPLLSVSREGGFSQCAIGSAALAALVKRRVAAEADALPARRAVVLAALKDVPAPELVAEHARLRMEHGDVPGAFALLASAPADPAPALRARLAVVMDAALAADPARYEDANARSVAARFLSPTAAGPGYALRLAEALTGRQEESDLEAAGRVAEHLLGARAYEVCSTLAEGAIPRGPLPPSLARARVLLAGCRALLLPSRLAASRPLLTAAVGETRRAGVTARRSPERLHLRALLDSVIARYRFLGGDNRRALQAASRARTRARRARASMLLTQAYTALAVVLTHEGRAEEAERASERAIRLKTALGDVRGAAGNLHNLARMKQQRGASMEAAAALNRVVAIATRYADAEIGALALLSLADLYDDQGNVRLALDATRRARAVCAAGNLQTKHDLCTRTIAILALQAGELAEGRRALLESARTARASHDPNSRAGHYRTSALAALYTGRPRRAAFLASRIPTRARPTPSADVLRALSAVRRAAVQAGAMPWSALPRPAKTADGAAFRRLLAAARQHADAVTDGGAVARRALERDLSPARFGVSGDRFRLAVEVVLAGARADARRAVRLRSTLDAIAAYAERSGLPLLAARALALKFTSDWAAGDQVAASRTLSAALAAYPPASASAKGSERASAFPVELEQALALLSARFGGKPDSADVLTSLHAHAHRLALALGPANQTDTRLQTALRTILAVAARLQTGGGLEALLESLNTGAREITGAERTCVVLLGPANERAVQITSGAGESESAGRTAPVSHTIIRRVLATRTPLLLHDVFGDSELMERPSITSMSLRSVLCVPMLRGPTLFGVMYADSSAGAGTFDKMDLEILSLFAEQAAAAIETSRLLADVQRSYSELKATQERLIRGERLRVMGEMTSGVAHDFNNLLTAILARIQLLNLGFLPPDVREGLTLIEKAALDAAAVVRRLQGFAKTRREAGFTRVDMADLCADVVELLRPLWSKRRARGLAAIAVRLHASPGLFVQGDPTELREILTNLLKNALEALERGGTVVLSAEARDGRVRVEVADDGPGIPADLRPRLFQPFFTTKGERGTGLGLCLSLQIAERHGGDLRLDSGPSGGTTAVLEIPQAPPEGTEAPVGALAAGSGADAAAPPAPRLNVLVVDDDPDVRAPLCTYLERSGFRVFGVGNAAEGLTRINEAEPDLVISDIVMPGIDGLELCRRLKTAHPRVPVVLISGHASGIDPAVVREAGATALLAKPFTMRQILDLAATLTRAS